LVELIKALEEFVEPERAGVYRLVFQRAEAG
jgi:hypothetical protein